MPRHLQKLSARHCVLRWLPLIDNLPASPRQAPQAGLRWLPPRDGLFLRPDIHRKKGIECKECHDVHYLNKDKKYCVSCHGSVAHSSLPSEKKHLASLTCVACHAKVGRTEVEVHLDIKGGKTLSALAINRNTLIDRAQWHALEDLLRTEYKGRYTIEKTYQASGDPHTITAKPAECDACHGSTGHFTAGRLRITGSENLEIPIDTRAFIPNSPPQKTSARRYTEGPG